MFLVERIDDNAGMAVEEAEYYSLHQGNGVSGGTRSESSTKRAAPKSKARAQSASATRLTPFLQGITLGAVLLIPVGVWCWVRADEIANPFDAQEASAPAVTVKAKQTSVPAKRKPMRSAAPAAPSVVRATAAGAVRTKRESPRAVTPAPVESGPSVSPPVAEPASITRPPDEESTGAGAGQKPKKGVWRTLASPFRDRSKDPIQPEPRPPVEPR